MAIYLCNECQELKDGDYFPAITEPDDECALLCEDCFDDKAEELQLLE